MKKLVLGIDLGTTNIKSAIYNLNGNLISSAKMSNNPVSPKPGLAEYNPDVFVSKVFSCIKNCIQNISSNYEVVALSISSMGEVGIPIDKKGSWLYPATSWFDQRTIPQFQRIEEEGLSNKIFSITGLPIHFEYSLLKLMWLNENHPDLVSRIYKWLCMHDFIIYILTGMIVTSKSIAVSTLGYDIRKEKWSSEIFDIAGINISIMPNIMNSGVIAGKISKYASSQTGLRNGIPVITGGHDHTCASFGAGAIKEGDVLDSTGTSEAVAITFNKLFLNKKIIRSGYRVEPHVITGKYIYFGGISTAGSLIDWLKNELSFQKNKNNTIGYSELINMAFLSEPFSTGLILLPHLSGSRSPDKDPESRGALLGLKLYTKKQDIIRACLEGIAMELKKNFEFLEDLFAKKILKIYSVGGLTKNNNWQQLKADITGKTFEISEVEDAASKGAAMLAALGIGEYKNPIECISKTKKVNHTYIPNKKLNKEYHKFYLQCYKNIYLTLKEVNRKLGKFELKNV